LLKHEGRGADGHKAEVAQHVSLHPREDDLLTQRMLDKVKR